MASSTARQSQSAVTAVSVSAAAPAISTTMRSSDGIASSSDSIARSQLTNAWPAAAPPALAMVRTVPPITTAKNESTNAPWIRGSAFRRERKIPPETSR